MVSYTDRFVSPLYMILRQIATEKAEPAGCPPCFASIYNSVSAYKYETKKVSVGRTGAMLRSGSDSHLCSPLSLTRPRQKAAQFCAKVADDGHCGGHPRHLFPTDWGTVSPREPLPRILIGTRRSFSVPKAVLRLICRSGCISARSVIVRGVDLFNILHIRDSDAEYRRSE